MKQYLIALALLLCLDATAAGVQPRHRHHPQTEQSQGAPGKGQNAVTAAADSTASQGIEAYSDTTSNAIDAEEDSTYTASWSNDSSYSNDFHGFLKDVLGGTIGFGGVLIALFVIFALLLCALAPFMVIIFLIRYLINRYNKRVSLAEKSMETGRPIPDDMRPTTSDTADFYWKKGIKNTAIGVGLVMMFSIWGSDVLVGVGALVACWGIGQMIIAKTSK